ncbi:MAG: dihydroorotate dehydrogenase [Oscillospiraceae bacterium]|jgi:dihydroorotate dehydrogenase (NAD+) catalytic subunit|nr:dihydroorotate dehydrogenase [Oscillospiraceae bacterium]
MVDTQVTLCGLPLSNPLIPASGTFGYGQEFAQLYDIDLLGTFSFKGTTAQPRFGNPTPRIAETMGGMLNAVGLQNPGVEAVVGEELPALAKIFHKPVMANVCGSTVEEYVTVAERLAACPQVGWLEVNISCPNVHAGGLAFGTTSQGAAQVTEAVKRVAGDKPVIMKLSPNVTDITEIARACAGAGADGLSLINTLLGMRLDLCRRRPLLGNTTGGLSGGAVFPIALRMVWQVYEAVKLPIVGMGGVETARDVIEMMMAGATAVGVGAANLTDPYACKRIIEELPQVMEELGIGSLKEIIGGAHHG